jgi:phosphonoacetaldehyde hydrolase
MTENKIQAVVFDWAGTTVDFGSRAPMGAFVKLFESEGIEMSIAQARIPMGMNKWDHIHELLKLPEIRSQWIKIHGRDPENADIDRLLSIFVPMNKISIQECASLIPGISDLTRVLREHGIKIGATTGYTKELLDILTPLAKEQGYAPDISSFAGDTPLGRPAPQMMQKCAKIFGIENPLAFIKVDDTLPGIDEGKAFGCWTVGVAVSGNALGLSYEELALLPVDEAEKCKLTARGLIREMHPDYVIDSVADLLPVIEDINRRLMAGELPNQKIIG